MIKFSNYKNNKFKIINNQKFNKNLIIKKYNNNNSNNNKNNKHNIKNNL